MQSATRREAQAAVKESKSSHTQRVAENNSKITTRQGLFIYISQARSTNFVSVAAAA